MEKFVELQHVNSNKRRIFHAKTQQDPERIATSKEQTLEHRTKCELHTNYDSNTTKRHNENSQPQQKQRQEQTPSQRQQYYYRQNAATTATLHEQQQQQQPQLTPTTDYFRFSALYALVATSATAAAYSMRDAYACVTAYDEVRGDESNNNDYTPHHHSTRQRRMPTITASELKRSRSSLTQPQLSKLLHATCLRSGEADIDVGVVAGAQGVSGCGFFSAIGTITGSSTSFVGGSSGGGGGLDTRSLFYLTLVFFIYCGVMMRASVAATATANATTLNNSSDSNEYHALISSASAVAVTNETMALIDKRTHNFIASPTPAPSTISVYAPAAPLPRSLAVDWTGAILSSSHNSSALAVMNASARAFEVDAQERLTNMQRVVKRDTAHVPDDDDDSAYHDDEFDEYEALINNRSAKGKYIGAPCFSNMTCETSLIHVTCDKETKTCGCEKNYPVQLGLTKGCAKAKKLGEQCFYDETCMYSDENSLCVQVRHNAMCQCAHGFHSVSHTKPTRRVFCTKDLKELSSDLPTLLGVSTGIAVLAGLICMVLHLFSKTKYPRPRNFGDANLPPPIMYSSETGSRRPSLASVHSTSSSVRSYSMMRFEKEAQQKEIRQEMKLRLARLQQQQHLNHNKPQIVIGDTLQHHMGAASTLSRLSGMPTPSPLTPNSTDELLPAVDELQEYPPKSDDLAATIHQMAAESVAASTLAAIKQAAAGTSFALTTTMGAPTMAASTSASGSDGLVTPDTPSDIAGAAAYIGPYNSSTEAL